MALPRGAEEPRLDHPPIKTYRFTGEAFTEGVEAHELDGVSVRIYSPEKTLADCFKFRNQVGLDTVMEAVPESLRSHAFILSQIIHLVLFLWRYRY